MMASSTPEPEQNHPSSDIIPKDGDIVSQTEDPSQIDETGLPFELAKIEAVIRQFSGPLPSPDILEGYEEIVPGSAKMIMDGFEIQGEHRRRQERRDLINDIIQSYLGMVLGFIILMTIIVGSVYLIYIGKQLGGAVGILSAAATSGYVYIHGNRYRREDQPSSEEEKD